MGTGCSCLKSQWMIKKQIGATLSRSITKGNLRFFEVEISNHFYRWKKT